MIEKTLNKLLQKCKCKKRKVAAIVVDADNIIVGTGYNHTPNGESCEDDNGITVQSVIHAEVAAVRDAGSKGVKLIVTHEPCPDCLVHINRAGLVFEVIDIFKKFDNNKNMISLVPPQTIEHIGKVLTYGAKKYTPNNWKKGSIDRYLDAAYRHLLAYQKGEWQDDESNLPHLAHLLTNVAFILYLEENKCIH